VARQHVWPQAGFGGLPETQANLDIEEATIEHQATGSDGPADGALVHAEAPGKGGRRFEEAAGLGFHFSLSSFQEKIE